ncbi:hypothetical protein NPIL_258041 [Nephila pilipes]|uniref:Uncharacterized protein n=1 Tax=Nephila pilipes TaxID=299642 RepID=A0A8X6U399_NEPPI|nr:hypothetical protein NPIL_258041 [Nephila pilipes]
MLFLSVKLVSVAFITAYESDRDEYINNYIDEVLSIYLPRAVENAGVDSYKMINLFFDARETSTDDEVTNGNVSFLSGKLEVLNSVHRKSYERFPTSSYNFNVICSVSRKFNDFLDNLLSRD